jgi:hypothetical protein
MSYEIFFRQEEQPQPLRQSLNTAYEICMRYHALRLDLMNWLDTHKFSYILCLHI